MNIFIRVRNSAYCLNCKFKPQQTIPSFILFKGVGKGIISRYIQIERKYKKRKKQKNKEKRVVNQEKREREIEKEIDRNIESKKERDEMREK